MKKNNLLPILLVAGAGVAAYMYFKNKGAAKEIADGVDVEPIESKTNTDDQSTTTNDQAEPGESRIDSYIKTGTSIVNKAKQIIRGRKKRKSRVIIEPTQSSSTPFADLPGSTRKQKRTARKTTRTAARTAKRTARTTRKQRRAVKGFDDLSVLY
jgi:hypothetical protein